MGVFGGIEGAKYSEGGVYVLPGVYRFQILECKYIKTGPHKGSKDCFVAELKIVESTNPERLPGSVCSHMVTITGNPSALGNIKQFISAAAACDEAAVNEAAAEAVVSPAQPLKDVFVRCSATNIKTKTGRDFTKCKYFNDAAGADAVMKEQAAAA